MNKEIIKLALTNYGSAGFEYGMAKAAEINCASYKDIPSAQELTKQAEEEYINSRKELEKLLGIE